jgi:glycosyltransferase involved in cell wall biosynthesis
MNIALVIRDKVPVKKYGGTERIVTWLSDSLAKKGHKVYIVAPRGSSSASGTVIELPNPKSDTVALPSDVDLVHNHSEHRLNVALPAMSTFHWIPAGRYDFQPNTVFVSATHARILGKTEFVHNGLDPAEFIYKEDKDDYFLFISRVSRSSKGVDRAVALAKRMGLKLIIAGGYKFVWSRKIRCVGMVGGVEKAELLANAKAVLFPINWPEPFGLVQIESLVSGTPVIGAPYGAVPEIITPDVGFICKDSDEMEKAVERIGEISPAACRARVLQHFTADIMADKYLRYYERLLATGSVEGAGFAHINLATAEGVAVSTFGASKPTVPESA